MSEGKKRVRKSEVSSPKSDDGNNSAPDSYRDDTSHSAINKSEIEHPKSEITNMEVHHHPEVEKKTFKEYLLEGLMIFLAVFMGFVAENIRENISEHKRAVEFARSYFEDIKKDTAALNAAMHFSKLKVAVMDSAVNMLHRPIEKRKDTLLFTWLSNSTNVMPFEPTADTYEQIKSSGSLRYFDQKLVNLMNSYDVQMKKTVKREDTDLKLIIEQIIPFFITNFNTEAAFDIYFTHHISHELYGDRGLSTSRKAINYAVLAKIERLRAMAEYVKQIKLSTEVLAELKKEYELE